MNPAARIAEAQVALMLLTRLPAGNLGPDAPTTGQAIWAFPLVGALVGVIGAAVHWVALTIGLPPFVAAVLAVSATVLATGALHEDGLADVADGFGGGQDRAAKLTIMRDSRIGSYGVVALILILALTIGSIAEAGATLSFITVGAISRSAMLLPMIVLPAARSDGLGHAAQNTSRGHLVAACLLALPFIILAPWPALAATGAALVSVRLAQKHIQGQTGDVLGATQKLAECAAWITAAAIL